VSVCLCVCSALLCSPRTPQAHHAMTTWETGGSAGHLVADRRCDVASLLLVGELVGGAGAPSVQLGLCCCRFGLLLLHLFCSDARCSMRVLGTREAYVQICTVAFFLTLLGFLVFFPSLPPSPTPRSLSRWWLQVRNTFSLLWGGNGLALCSEGPQCSNSLLRHHPRWTERLL
jgi:hypothetical protein